MQYATCGQCSVVFILPYTTTDLTFDPFSGGPRLEFCWLHWRRSSPLHLPRCLLPQVTDCSLQASVTRTGHHRPLPVQCSCCAQRTHCLEHPYSWPVTAGSGKLPGHRWGCQYESRAFRTVYSVSVYKRKRIK